MSSRDKFLAEIEAFLKRHNMAAGRLGIDAMSDNKFVSRLRSGEGCTLDTYDKVRKYMADRDTASEKRQKKANQASVAA